MKEIFTQIRDRCPFCKQKFGPYFLPWGDDDREKSLAFKLYQIVRNKIYGVEKERSLKQLRTYWAACQFLADNTEHKQWNTKNKVDFQCRVDAHLVDKDLIVVRPNGEYVFCYLSIAFKNMAHLEACHYFDIAYGTMAAFWNTTKKQSITGDEFVELVKKAIADG